MNIYKIPHFGLNRQYTNLKDELLEATHLAMRDGILVDGQYSRNLVDWLKQRTKAKYAVLVHSGTQALEIIAKYWHDALISDTFDISIPNITYPATFNAIKSAGWNIEIVDTDSNGLMLTNEINTYWFCSVGLYGAMPPKLSGNPSFIDGAQHWLTILDGDVDNGVAVSFDPTKNLSASGNGGAILTNDYSLSQFALNYRDNGKPYFEEIGSNSKLSEIDCSHLLVRANYINEWQNRRKQIKEFYIEEFKDLPIRCLSKGISTHADQKFVIYYEQRDELRRYLDSVGIETRIHYNRALSDLVLTKDIETKPTWLSTSVMLIKGVLSLPIYPELTDGEVEYIVKAVKHFFHDK